MTPIVTKVAHIQFIDGECHIKNRKAVKLLYPVIMHMFCVTCYLWPWGQTHIHTHTYTNVHGQNYFKKPGTCGPAACVCLV